MLGLKKHRDMQVAFGDRLQDIEKYANIKPVELPPGKSSSLAYVQLMRYLFLISFILFIVELFLGVRFGWS